MHEIDHTVDPGKRDFPGARELEITDFAFVRPTSTVSQTHTGYAYGDSIGTLIV